MNLSAKKKMRGFTLVELMVAILLSSLAAVAFYRGYMAATIGYDVQAHVTELNQNVRFGLEKMARELRMAGYNPARVSGSGFVTANSNTVRFTKDMNGNGVISGDTEDIALAVGGNELTRNGSAVVGNVDAPTARLPLPWAISVLCRFPWSCAFPGRITPIPTAKSTETCRVQPSTPRRVTISGGCCCRPRCRVGTEDCRGRRDVGGCLLGCQLNRQGRGKEPSCRETKDIRFWKC